MKVSFFNVHIIFLFNLNPSLQKKSWTKKLEILVAFFVLGVTIPNLLSENWTFLDNIPKILCSIAIDRDKNLNFIFKIDL